MQRRSVIEGVGSYLPARILTNADLARIVDTSDEWIVERTGIRERRIAAEGETTATWPSLRRRRCARRMPASSASDIDLIIARHLDARQYLSGDGGHGAGGARHHARRRLRHPGGVLGLRLCA